MIFRIDKSIMTQGQSVIQDFARGLTVAADNQHAVQLPVQVWEWVEKEILQTDVYLGKLMREQLVSSSELWNPTKMLLTHETTVDIGYVGNMLTVRDMLRLMEEPGWIVLENGRYDGTVIEKWVRIYRKEKGLGTINAEVYRAMAQSRLRVYNSGGGNMSIANAIDTLMRAIGYLYPYRITTIFDSDKRSATDTTDHNQKLKEYLTHHRITGHELRKREIENYFAVDTYKRAGFLKDERQARAMTAEEWDFHDIGKSNIIRKTDNTGKETAIEKKDVETLSYLLTKEELKERVLISSGDDEIQSIILQLAKFI